MLPTNLGDTQPNSPFEETQPNLTKDTGKRNFPRWLPILVALALVIVGVLSGYGSGMGLRYSTENNVVNSQLADQFQKGQQALDAGQYEVARQHFEFILNKNPNYPGIQTAMADLLIKMNITPTATYTQTPEISPTADTRSQEDQFKSAQDLLKAGKWNDALAALDTLRKLAPDYQTAQVDGMYYTALYQRAFTEIRPPEDCHATNLNAGIIDFTQAEHFGPLDNTAQGLRTYARLYIAGASYWDQDWKQAQDLFAQVMAAYSTLMDSSCQTAAERWRQATIHYAEQLANAGDMCGASEQFQAAFSVNSPNNEEYFDNATQAADECNGGNNSNEPAAVNPTETPTLTVEAPTAPPVPSETPTTGG